MIPKPLMAALLSFLLVPASAQALEVILDTGEGQPAGPYLERLEGAEEPTPRNTAALPPLNDAAERMLPIEPSRLRVAPLQGQPPAHVRETLRNMPRPLCLVGSDSQSLAWLEHHRVALMQAGAVCMLVQADTPEDLERVRDTAHGIPVQLSHGDDLAERLQLDVYPVLISREGIEQ